jgi:hypothetical protein
MKEYKQNDFSKEIKTFISTKKSTKEYMEFVVNIFKKKLNICKGNSFWEFIKYIENETDFFTAPASTKFHSNEENGLVRHSLLVLAYGLELAPIMLLKDFDFYYLIISCLFHDLCKVNMYETKERNVKNEVNGNWEKMPFYKVKDDYLSYGHGIESMIRLNKYIEMPESWNHAIRWHMGAYDITQMDKLSLEKSYIAYREVLFLQTADMLAGLVDNI